MRLYEALQLAITDKAIIYVESRESRSDVRRKQIRAVQREHEFYGFEQRLFSPVIGAFLDWDNTPMTLSLDEIDAYDWIAIDAAAVKREEAQKERKEKKEIKEKVFDLKKALERFERWVD